MFWVVKAWNVVKKSTLMKSWNKVADKDSSGNLVELVHQTDGVKT